MKYSPLLYQDDADTPSGLFIAARRAQSRRRGLTSRCPKFYFTSDELRAEGDAPASSPILLDARVMSDGQHDESSLRAPLELYQV